MDKDKYFGELDHERRKARTLQYTLAGCVLIMLIMMSTIRAQTGETKTAFIPPEISRPFWISSEDASQSYFEDMGQFINSLPLNVTPETVRQACHQYLAYVLPKDRDLYKTRCDQQESRVKRDGTSSMFAAKVIRTDLKHRRVAFTGDNITIVSGKALPPRLETYVLEFVPYGGRFYIANHDKVDNHDPFANKK